MMSIFLDLSTKPKRLRPELLLHPTIPPALWRVNPRTIEGKEWWDVTRREAYRRSGYYCEACGVYQLDALFHPRLEAHECYILDAKNFKMYFVEVVALCHACHCFIHWRTLKFSHEHKLDKVLVHGFDLLFQHDMLLPRSKVEFLSRWHGNHSYDEKETFEEEPTYAQLLSFDWKLVYENEEYPRRRK